MRSLFVAVCSLILLSISSDDKKNTLLEPCPNSPNCVSTLEKRKRKRLNPLVYEGNLKTAIDKLTQILEKYPEAELIEQTSHYFHYEFTTKVGSFIDDVEFLIYPSENTVHFRSASRVGYGDFGKNRRRMKEIADEWAS
ncbi:MAG: DUF1499 domain-containing protein [Crocinitomicaceae bacterium]